ncbi:hypothetical protein GOP47_0004916, partial [Adiantum capillus-veneris]
MGNKRCRDGADLKPLKSSGHVVQKDLLAHDGGYCQQGCRELENCEADRARDEMYEDCRQHQRKRPRRVTKSLVNLSEYEKFCLGPSCTPVCYQLPCEVLDAATALEDFLQLSLFSQAASASLNSQAIQHGSGNKQLHVHADAHGLQSEHEISCHKRKLMECKLKIMATRLKYGLDVWTLAAQLVNPYEVLPSVAVRVLNRAFFKMWELMQMFPGLVPPVAAKSKLLSAHMCEGPGGFIQAVRRFRSQDAKHEESIRTEISFSTVDSSSGEKEPSDSWFAISLSSPGSENDALQMQTFKIQEFMRKSDEGHVHYGADESGDVTNPDNISSFVQFVLKKTGGEKMHLITGDGAFDISDDFSSQEQSHAHLFFCEIILAVQLQCRGGALVLKVFDCFTEVMKALLYILASLYTTVEIVRLRTSRVCNSERFLVAHGFRFLPKILKDKLMSISLAWYDAARDGFSATVKFSGTYPPSFLEALNQGNAAVAKDQSDEQMPLLCAKPLTSHWQTLSHDCLGAVPVRYNNFVQCVDNKLIFDRVREVNEAWGSGLQHLPKKLFFYFFKSVGLVLAMVLLLFLQTPIA